ncbi:MAG: hypothetical protein CMF62_00450 [Magnetococcales bacterium]|nr:hypothetical protein [Magnetococcales bacterium]
MDDVISQLKDTSIPLDNRLKLITSDVCKMQSNGYTFLMELFKTQDISTEIYMKVLDLDCEPNKQNDQGYTALMYSFRYYGETPNCDSKVLLKLLDLDCEPNKKLNNYGWTALMFAFRYYGTNSNCDSQVLLKLLDLDCEQNNITNEDWTTLMTAFTFLKTNNINIYEKLINITKKEIINHKNRFNSNILLQACKFMNRCVLDYAIKKFYYLIDSYLVIDYEYYSYEKNFYCIDYLVNRIIDIDKLYYSDDIPMEEIDNYYLLQLVDRVDNYEKYCSELSAEFIRDTLKTRELKDIVLSDLLLSPPIKGFYCGGKEYWDSFNRFELLQ